MNKQDALELIDALRSGKYTKTIGKLGVIDKSGEERNCCLGVLCRLKGLDRSLSHHVVLYDGYDDYAPNALGLRDREMPMSTVAGTLSLMWSSTFWMTAHSGSKK